MVADTHRAGLRLLERAGSTIGFEIHSKLPSGRSGFARVCIVLSRFASGFRTFAKSKAARSNRCLRSIVGRKQWVPVSDPVD